MMNITHFVEMYIKKSNTALTRALFCGFKQIEEKKSTV